MDAPESKDQEAQAARKSELDGCEAQFGKYVREYGPLNMVHLTVGVQGFSVFWEDDPAQSPATNAAQRRWFKRMLCCALHHLVENEADLHSAELDRLRGEVEGLRRELSSPMALIERLKATPDDPPHTGRTPTALSGAAQGDDDGRA